MALEPPKDYVAEQKKCTALY